MKMPWHNQTGLTRDIAILATVFGIACGLCGLNAAAASFTHSAGNLLIMTGLLELGVMILSGACLLILGIIAICRAIVQRFHE